MATYLSNKEHNKIARELEKHHTIFERIWTMSRIRFTNQVSTAGVLFNEHGDCIDFVINPKFWESLSFVNKCFVLAHECLHIALNHGSRNSGLTLTKNILAMLNIAQDIVINHSLVERYGFFRDDFDPIMPIFNQKGQPVIDQKTGKQMLNRKYCWVESVFPDNADLATDENFEYYYTLLKNLSETRNNLDDILDRVGTVDDHEFNQQGSGDTMGMESGDGAGGGDDNLEFFDSDEYSDDFGDIIDKLNDELSPSDKDTLKTFLDENDNSDIDSQSSSDSSSGEGGSVAGTEAGNGWTYAAKMPLKKHKFESIITKWAKNKLIVEDVDVDQWVFKNRRFGAIDSGSLSLPMDMEVEDDIKKNEQIDVWFYQDTSGSCQEYRDRFFTIAESMPLEKFNFRLFCFDTKIYETSLESRELKGFGGTKFHIIENHIQKELIENPATKQHPDAIFVVTDGLGTDVNCSQPEKWHWILTPKGSTENIPKACNLYDLAKYE